MLYVCKAEICLPRPVSISHITTYQFLATTPVLMQLSVLRRTRLHTFRTLCAQRRGLLTIAIETSCDDTSVAILEKHKNNSATLHFHESITSDNREFRGLHPLVVHEYHQQNVAILVKKALQSLPAQPSESANFGEALLVKGGRGVKELRRKPDFVTATRGPGMRASLITGIDTAKGLSVAWDVPFLGVNHMQAHALTPRLITALEASNGGDAINIESKPSFPFLSLLVSGGNSMLVNSQSLSQHSILARTTDIAVGDMIDKCARDILPEDVLNASIGVSYGPSLERYAFPSNNSVIDYNYTTPKQKKKKNGSISSISDTRNMSLKPRSWSLAPPMSNGSSGGPELLAATFSFSGIGSSVKRIVKDNPSMQDSERRVLAREIMRVAFEHLGSRVLMALQGSSQGIKTLVVSGGVASNQYLKHILRAMLDSNGHMDIDLVFPPLKFCTDNAAMIAWTGIEMWEAGYRTKLDAMALRKWDIDSKSKDGGILGAYGWTNVYEDCVRSPVSG